jgi:hypothetical protein
MRSNAQLHAEEKFRAEEKRTGAEFRPEDFVLLPESAAATTIAMHEAWARNWSCWNQVYKETHELFRPFYMFPLEMAQQYFAFILGLQQCISEPIGRQTRRVQAVHVPGLQLVEDECEVLERAMDIATGADTALWAEVVEVGRSAAAA